MSPALGRRSMAALGAVAVALLALLIAEPVLTRPPLPAPLRPGAGEVRADAGGAPAADRGGGQVATILARPLFYPDRRPPAATASAGAAALPIPRLSGILISAAGREAFFAAAGDTKSAIAHVGDRVGTFTISAIDPDQVTLLGAGGVRHLRPSFGPAAEPVVPAGAAGMPQPPVSGAPQGAPRETPSGASISGGSILDQLQAHASHPALVPVPPPPSIEQMLAPPPKSTR